MSREKITSIEWTSSPTVTMDKAPPGIPDLEDGELSDEDSDLDDYNILPRPAHLIPTPMNPVTGGVVASKENVGGGIKGELVYSDEEEGIPTSSEDDDDSDDDHPALKRRMQPISFNSGNVLPFRNPNALGFMETGLAETPKTDLEEKMMNFQQKRKVNNIWADVLQEEQQQQALDKFESIDVDGQKILIERGPESYTYKRGTSGTGLKRKRSDKMNKTKRNDDESDVSSTALSDDDLSYIRKKAPSENEKIKNPRGKIRSGFAETGEQRISELREKLGKMKGRKLAYLLARELEEPKSQLIVRACEILGKHYCIDLFIKTLKIEKKSGLLVKNQTRRRTPGGVFFYMMRKDDKYPQKKIDDVFEVDKQIVSRDKRNIRAARRKEQKAKIERLQHRQDKMKGTKPMDQEKKDCTEANVDEEDGELPSVDNESYTSDSGSESDMSDCELEEEVALSIRDQDLADEASNDYLDIHCNVDEFSDL